MTTKTVTPEDIIKAAEENGYTWNRTGWFGRDYNSQEIISACVLGQVALNLEIDHSELWNYLRKMKVTTTVNKVRLSSVGSITNVNDNPEEFNVKTYKRIVKILKDLLKPHMDHEPLKAQIVYRHAKKINTKEMVENDN